MTGDADGAALLAQTTLMDVIAGRKTQGEIRGEILVNGFPSSRSPGRVWWGTWSRTTSTARRWASSSTASMA